MVKEHHWHIRFYNLGKSATKENSINLGHHILIPKSSIQTTRNPDAQDNHLEKKLLLNSFPAT
jgi:hypothetical protein